MDRKLASGLVVMVVMATVVGAGICRCSIEGYSMLFEILDKDLKGLEIPNLAGLDARRPTLASVAVVTIEALPVLRY
jgi:hypothetical protein